MPHGSSAVSPPSRYRGSCRHDGLTATRRQRPLSEGAGARGRGAISRGSEASYVQDVRGCGGGLPGGPAPSVLRSPGVGGSPGPSSPDCPPGAGLRPAPAGTWRARSCTILACGAACLGARGVDWRPGGLQAWGGERHGERERPRTRGRAAERSDVGTETGTGRTRGRDAERGRRNGRARGRRGTGRTRGGLAALRPE